MKKLQLLTNCLILIFLAINGFFLARLMVEMIDMNDRLHKVEPVADKAIAFFGDLTNAGANAAAPAEALLLEVLKEGLQGNSAETGAARRNKFEAYFKKIETSKHRFYRHGRERSAERMVSKLKSKYSGLSLLIKDDRQLLHMITHSTSAGENGMTSHAYQVERDGKKMDLMDWLLDEK